MSEQSIEYKYLSNIDIPSDLRKLPESALREVADEVREYMVDTITKVGGHFGAGLGVVELTVALHYVFDTPKDKIVIDTGHQGYPHKILTGRKNTLHTIRQKDGLSGFLKRTESEYDEFGAGHASTSISAALGIASARDLLGQDNHVVAVIGDGAMTGGLVYEAMNNCGVQQKKLIVILNDNQMSIAPNVWALSNYFSNLFASPTAQKIRSNIWDMTGKTGEFNRSLFADHFILHARIEKLLVRLFEVGAGGASLFEVLARAFSGSLGQIGTSAARSKQRRASLVHLFLQLRLMFRGDGKR